MNNKRKALVSQLRRSLGHAVGGFPSLKRARNVHLRMPETLGHRAGILRVSAGMHTGLIRKDLEADGRARLRQLFPTEWLGQGEPSIYWEGAELCIEAPWPEGLRTEAIMLSQMSEQPHTPGSFTLGQNDRNVTVTPRFDTYTSAHMLLAGAPGGGKTTTATSIAVQLARNDPRAQFVIANDKNDLEHLDTLHGLLGPLAGTYGEVLTALAFVDAERGRREQAGGKHAPLYFLWDEPQIVLMEDKQAPKTLFYLMSRARSANIHVILATQSPKQSLFGVNMTRGQFGTRICHLVANAQESKAALDVTEPRADYLTEKGDAIASFPPYFHRVLVALPDQDIIESVLGHDPAMSHWPVSLDDLPSRPGWTPEQVAVGIMARRRGWNRRECREELGRLGGSVSNADYSEMRAFGQRVDEIIEDVGNA